MGTICPCLKHNQKKTRLSSLNINSNEEQPLKETEIVFEQKPKIFDLNEFEDILKTFGVYLNPKQNIPSLDKNQIELQIKNLYIPKNKKIKNQAKAINKERKLSINDDDLLYSNMKPGENPAFSIPNSPEKSQIKKKNKEKSLSVSSPITTFDYSEEEKNTYSQNFELENVVSLWDWDFLNLFKKIELKDYTVMEKVGDNLKLKDKSSSSIYELSILQLHILSNLKRNKSNLNFNGFCAITSINILPIKSNVDFGRINFNIVTLKESGLASLQLLINHGFTFKMPELYTFLKQMIQLGYRSEELDIANRFINPNNIILSEKLDEWKLADYSFACSLESSIKQVLKPKIPQNCSYYQAPELLANGGFYNPFMADVFSLGLVALAGAGVEEHNLFSYASKQKDIEFIIKEFQKKMNYQNNDLGRQIENLIRKMLVIEPAKREKFFTLNDLIIKMKGENIDINFGEISVIIDRIPLFDTKDKWKLLKTQGDSYFNMGLFEKSFTYYSDAIKNFYLSLERNVDIEIELEIKKAISKFESGDLIFSLKLIDSASKLNPTSIQKEIEILNLKSMILCKLTRFMESIDCLQNAFRKLKQLNDPLSLLKKKLEAEIYKNLCQLILDQSDNFKKAYNVFEAIINIYSSSREFAELEIFALIYFADCLNRGSISILAIQKYQLAIEKTKNLYGNHHPLIPFCYQMMGEILFNNNEILKSKLCFKRAVEELKIIFGKKSYETANGKAKYGKILLFNKEHKTALLLLKESLETVLKYDGECKFMSQIWISIAEAYILYKDYDKGLKFYQRTLEFYKDNKDKRICSPLEMIDLIESIGHVYFLKGDKQKMISYYYEALIMRKEISILNSEALADAYENIGDLLFELEDYQLCLENYLHALNSFNSMKYPNVNRLIRLNQLIGRMYYNLGEKTSAITFIKAALDLIESNHQIFDVEDQTDNKIDTIELMASIYYELCNYKESLKYYITLLKSKQEIKEEANCLHNIGVIYYKQEDYQLAEEFMMKSLKFRENLKNETVKSISSLRLLSSIFHHQGKNEEERKNDEMIKALCSQSLPTFDDIRTSLIRPSKF